MWRERRAAPTRAKLERFTRRILFVKPEAILIFDTLRSPGPAQFEWRLHAPVEMAVQDQRDVRVVNGAAGCRVSFLWPDGMTLEQTDRFEPPPRARIQLVEYHLTAIPSSSAREQTFVTLLRPHRSGETLNGEAELVEIDGGYAVTIPLAPATRERAAAVIGGTRPDRCGHQDRRRGRRRHVRRSAAR